MGESLGKGNRGIVLRHILADKEHKHQAEQQMSDITPKIDAVTKEYEKSITTEEDRRLFSAIAPTRMAMREVRDRGEPRSGDADRGLAFTALPKFLGCKSKTAGLSPKLRRRTQISRFEHSVTVGCDASIPRSRPSP